MQDVEAKPYRELTFAAVALGVMIGALMTAAFVHIALKLDFTMPGSTVAAILGFAILRGIMRRDSIVDGHLAEGRASLAGATAEVEAAREALRGLC